MAIQGQILVPDPFFNEPGFESQRNTTHGRAQAEAYAMQCRSDTLQHALLVRAAAAPPVCALSGVICRAALLFPAAPRSVALTARRPALSPRALSRVAAGASVPAVGFRGLPQGALQAKAGRDRGAVQGVGGGAGQEPAHGAQPRSLPPAPRSGFANAPRPLLPAFTALLFPSKRVPAPASRRALSLSFAAGIARCF